MIDSILFFGFIIVTAILLAKVEIQIEGKDGYAKNFPITWRTRNKWVRIFLTGTSYHLYMGLFLLVFVHLGFVVGWPWSPAKEMLVLSFLVLMTVAEDFLWFVLNPHYGVRKFRAKEVGWFQWVWGVPIWYWWYLPIGMSLYIGSVIL